jgi:Tfp pilus assembly protein PilF
MRAGVPIAVGMLVALAGCSTQPMRDLRELFQPASGTSALRLGLRQYDSGQYADAARSLQTAVELGLNDSDNANAHKHLAFINCAAQRERACRDEFRRALRADPQLELSPAEAGHPVWGPVFASLKVASPFKNALQQYEAGDYDESAKSFEGALRQGLGDKERASAHKHLAFIHCAAQRERECRDEFRKALAVDPALELEPAEAGHPVWGPVFRAVKAGR